MQHSPKVSVIIPVYGVERFIERCARSLMEQTLDNVEYIFVDDASKDKSMEILQTVLKCYPKRENSIQIVRHNQNKGLPAARNTGLEIASGEYVFHCDSDDFMELGALEALYNQAKQDDADIVWSDWFLTFEKNERYMHEPSFSTPEAALKAMLGGGMKFNVWNKLAKRTLYTDYKIVFPSGYGMGEDMTMILLFAYAKKVSYLPKAFYHYVKMNTQAISRAVSTDNLCALKYNVGRIEKILNSLYGDKYNQEIAFLKLEVKFPFLIMAPDSALYKLWQEWYPEANRFILKNKNVSLRSRLVQMCARYHMYWLVRLHYWLICRLVYGVIYR